MNRFWKTAIMASLAATAVPALAQEIYAPTRTAADQGIKLVGWGNGRVAEVEDMAYEGTQSIRFSSRNFFQGGILDFSNPVNLSSAFSNKGNLLHFTINVPGATSGGAGGGGLSRGGLKGGGGGGGTAGAAGLAGGGQEGERGSSGGGSSASPTEFSKVRVVITTTDGLRSEAYIDLKTVPEMQGGWKSVGIPLQAISGFERTNKTVKSIAISGDAVATYYLGALKILNDNTPVFAEPNVRELNLAFSDEVTFSASGSAGSTPLKFMWDFDSRDGINTDAEGQVVKRRFRKPGEFEVTLTAIDIYGLKQPYTTKIKVVVNP